MIFSKALNADKDNMCTSSMIKTLNFAPDGVKREKAMIFSRTLSTPVLDAASISTISICRPAVMLRQLAHLLHGSYSPSFLFSQLTALASTRAKVVLPTARGPQNK